MADILWNQSKPADGDPISSGDDEIRSIKTSLQVGLSEEHEWPSNGVGVGSHKTGSARAYYGLQSNVSANQAGRLMVASNSSRLFHVGSDGTMLLGSKLMLSAGSRPATLGDTRHHWVTEFGSEVITSGSGHALTFPNSGYSGAPFLTFSYATSGARAILIKMTGTSKTGATIVSWTTDDALVTGHTLHWISIGTKVLGDS
jgi:hypothetical protein